MSARERRTGRPERESLVRAARRREIVVVWCLDRWGQSVADLMTTFRELDDPGVGFVSLTETLDLTAPTGWAMAGMLAIFAVFEREILREQVRAGIAQLKAEGVSQSEIARRLGIGRTSVRRLLAAG